MDLAWRVLEMGGPPLIGIATACLLHSLPEGMVDFLTAWTLVSLPIGMVIGHCALSEDQAGV